MPIVIIEMADADRGSALAPVLVDACSRSVAEGRCALAADVEQPEATAVAIVRWDDARQSVSVSVGLRRVARSEWLSRKLDFRDADVPRERWRSVGLVIATLVGEADRGVRGSGVPEDTSRPADAMRPPHPSAPKAPPPPDAAAVEQARIDESARAAALSRERAASARAWIDAGGVIDAGIGGWLQAGGFLRANIRPSSLPLFVHAGGRYVAAPTSGADLSLSWLSAAAGVGAVTAHNDAGLRLELHLDAVAQRLRASATIPTAPSTESSGRWVPGVRAGVDVSWMLSSTWGLVAGGESTLLASGTALQVSSERRGRDASVTFGALAGLRARFY